jgi:hypothetical protein
VTGYLFEESSRPEDVKVTAAPAELLVRLGVTRRRGRPGRGRWEDVAVDDIDDPANAETVRLLVEHFDASRIALLRDGTVGVWRPGKMTEGASATVGWIAAGVVTVWSSHWPGFHSKEVLDVGQLRRKAGLVDEPVFVVPDIVVLPAGYRYWRDGDGLVPEPELDAAAYHGLIGDYLHLVEGETEAHPAAIGAHLIPCVGTMLGRSVCYAPDVQYPATYWAVVGPTSTAAKGAALKVALALIKEVRPEFLMRHSISGIGSGETLVYEMRDAEGPEDDPVETRRIVLNAELSRVLKVVRKDGSILGDVLREAYDGLPLRHSAAQGKKRAVSSNHHLSIVGSITPRELRALTEELSILNGFSNRYLYAWATMATTLAFGGSIDRSRVIRLAREVENRLAVVDRLPEVNGTRSYGFATERSPLWKEFYDANRRGLSETPALEAVTGRQVSHAARVALVYAALDGHSSISDDHVRAGIAWADYSLGTVLKVFTTGPAGRAGQLLEAIREKGTDGLDGVGQHDVFKRNLQPGELEAIREDLEARHLIVTASFATGGRPRLVSYAIWPENRP